MSGAQMALWGTLAREEQSLDLLSANLRKGHNPEPPQHLPLQRPN